MQRSLTLCWLFSRHKVKMWGLWIRWCWAAAVLPRTSHGAPGSGLPAFNQCWPSTGSYWASFGTVPALMVTDVPYSMFAIVQTAYLHPTITWVWIGPYSLSPQSMRTITPNSEYSSSSNTYIVMYNWASRRLGSAWFLIALECTQCH